jgi:hypothetical protein
MCISEDRHGSLVPRCEQHLTQLWIKSHPVISQCAWYWCWWKNSVFMKPGANTLLLCKMELASVFRSLLAGCSCTWMSGGTFKSHAREVTILHLPGLVLPSSLWQPGALLKSLMDSAPGDQALSSEQPGRQVLQNTELVWMSQIFFLSSISKNIP